MKACIFANGPMAPATPASRHLDAAGLIIAVDGGARHCRALSRVPDILVGDMDSVDSEDLDAATAAGARIHRHPARKDRTDLALAMELALEHHALEIVIFGALGNRWDMSLANLMLLTDPTFAGTGLQLLDGRTRIVLLRSGLQHHITGQPGDTVSLIPAGENVHGLTLDGFEYPLDRHTMGQASTLGVSNVLHHPPGRIVFDQGLLFCIVIEQEALHP